MLRGQHVKNHAEELLLAAELQLEELDELEAAAEKQQRGVAAARLTKQTAIGRVFEATQWGLIKVRLSPPTLLASTHVGHF